MRKKVLGIGLLVLAVFGLVLGGAAAYRGSPGPNPSASRATDVGYGANYTQLSADEQNGLLYMVEEEKLARDVYLVLYNETGLQVFGNIAQSEQRHMDAVLGLIEKYNLTAPDTLNQVGVFQNEELQALYNQLIEMGSKNVTSALKVGALIEETDIKDLQDWMAKSNSADINSVYEHLMAGSENHLRAFTRNLEAYGVTYTPQVLSEEQYSKIISSTNEMKKGSEKCRGRGKGNGMRQGHRADRMKMNRGNGHHPGAGTKSQGMERRSHGRKGFTGRGHHGEPKKRGS
ncbi:MAG: DUF2202 domain-containing protein [Thermococci archaeon]|nr:DUF2202 domain-containing protein [Thermococci archaeon]